MFSASLFLVVCRSTYTFFRMVMHTSYSIAAPTTDEDWISYTFESKIYLCTDILCANLYFFITMVDSIFTLFALSINS